MARNVTEQNQSSCGDLEDKTSERNKNSKGLTCKISEANKVSIKN